MPHPYDSDQFTFERILLVRESLALRSNTFNGWLVSDCVRTRIFPRAGWLKALFGNVIADFHGISFFKIKTPPKWEAFKVPDG
jgi:hypothetical protein